ncbi:MAG TPA: ABC transporter ATP-binding protein [Anaerolineae bacterium]|nr:ABC transporter ATP-binding protein [Anaerolineae bacterium]
MSDEWAIETHHLRKAFGDKVAVADLNLTVARGEVFGFLGPNGAGKTTSVKMLLGLVVPTAGEARILGAPLGQREARRRVGFLPEHFRFYDWLQAGEFLDFHGRLYGVARAKRRALIPDLLDLVGLGGREKSRLRSFSKGMLQRIGLAQALLNDPELVILDEPTSGLDPLGRRLVRDIVRQLREEGTAVFINSHLLSEIEQTCDRVAFIREGRILEVSEMASLNQGMIKVAVRVGEPQAQLLRQLVEFDPDVMFDEADGRLRLHLDSEARIPDLANWLVAHGYTIYELSPEKLSLEERFLQVIGG